MLSFKLYLCVICAALAGHNSAREGGSSSFFFLHSDANVPCSNLNYRQNLFTSKDARSVFVICTIQYFAL